MLALEFVFKQAGAGSVRLHHHDRWEAVCGGDERSYRVLADEPALALLELARAVAEEKEAKQPFKDADALAEMDWLQLATTRMEEHGRWGISIRQARSGWQFDAFGGPLCCANLNADGATLEEAALQMAEQVSQLYAPGLEL